MISIIVPIYNIAPYIERCVDSVLSQTYDNWELILVDDGSTDGSTQVCDEQVERDARIRVLHKENQGVALARRDGVRCAKGDWIMFVDGDDTLTKDAIELLLGYDNGCFDIIGASFKRIIQNKEYIPQFSTEGILSKEQYMEALLLETTYIGPCAKLIHRQLFDDLDWDCPRYVIQNEDLLMLMHLSNKAKQIYIAKDLIYNYICRSNSASQSQKMILDGWIYIFNTLSKLIIDNGKINYAFVHYRLVRFKDNIVLKGIKLTEREEVVLDVLNDSKKYFNLLNKEDKFILSILANRYKREIYYFYYKLKLHVKKTIKRYYG